MSRLSILRSVVVPLSSVLVFAVAGCSGGLDKFPVAPVRGRVVCEGQPVPHVNVYFAPLKTGDSAVIGKSGFAVADESGQFVLTTYDDGDGAVVGKHRVRVEAPRGERANGFDCKCVLGDTIDVMEVEITADKEHDIEVKLAKKELWHGEMSADEKEEREGI